MATKVPNPVWHAVVVWLSHSSTWTAVFGVVLGVVALCVGQWPGLEGLTGICNILAALLPTLFAVIAGAQKLADGKTQGETSAYNQYLRIVSDAAKEATANKDGDK